MSALPRLCAHRGNAAACPENTLPALESALTLRIPFVEFDVQLTADAVPVLFHDETLRRTTGRPGKITDLPWRAVRHTAAGEPARFGDRFSGTSIPSLADAVALLDRYPAARAFVEIKKESVAAFGVGRVMGCVVSAIAPVHERVALISFERRVVEAVPPELAAGWVVRGYDRRVRAEAAELAPAYLFINRTRLPRSGTLWSGAWEWCVYDVPEPEQGLALHRRGAHIIETAAVDNYVRHPAFSRALA